MWYCHETRHQHKLLAVRLGDPSSGSRSFRWLRRKKCLLFEFRRLTSVLDFLTRREGVSGFGHEDKTRHPSHSSTAPRKCALPGCSYRTLVIIAFLCLSEQALPWPVNSHARQSPALAGVPQASLALQEDPNANAQAGSPAKTLSGMPCCILYQIFSFHGRACS